MTGGGDPDCRRGMVWDEKYQDADIYEWYRTLIRLRKEYPCLTEGKEEEAEIKKAMLDSSESVFFLCDHTKIGKIGVPVISDFSRLDTLITDRKMTDEWREMLAKNDINLIEAL